MESLQIFGLKGNAPSVQSNITSFMFPKENRRPCSQRCRCPDTRHYNDMARRATRHSGIGRDCVRVVPRPSPAAAYNRRGKRPAYCSSAACRGQQSSSRVRHVLAQRPNNVLPCAESPLAWAEATMAADSRGAIGNSEKVTWRSQSEASERSEPERRWWRNFTTSLKPT
jgi:hypothetical protein